MVYQFRIYLFSDNFVTKACTDAMNATLSLHDTPVNTTLGISGSIERVSQLPGFYPPKSYPTSTLVSSIYAQLFSGFCALLACFISLHQVRCIMDIYILGKIKIYCHLKHYTCFSEQRYIVRILTIVPAYAVYSFTSLMLALHAKMNSTYVEPIHDIAEGKDWLYCYQYRISYSNILFSGTLLPIPGRRRKYYAWIKWQDYRVSVFAFS